MFFRLLFKAIVRMDAGVEPIGRYPRRALSDNLKFMSPAKLTHLQVTDNITLIGKIKKLTGQDFYKI